MDDNNQKILEMVSLDIEVINDKIKNSKSELKKLKIELSNKIKIRNIASGEKPKKQKKDKKVII